jgi:hemoglobin-like flavoprotein
MKQPIHAIAQQSYSRCLRAPDFFADFYERLLASDPAIPPMFEQTEFPKQHNLLRHGLGLLLSYAKNPEDALLDRLAARHSECGIGVSRHMYDCFSVSLLDTVRQHDPRFTDETEEAWIEALRPGIEFMTSRYGS